MSIISELKRRNIARIAFIYIATSWLIIQVIETLLPIFGFSDDAIRTVVIVLGVAFVPVLILVWIFELTPDGLKFDSDVSQSTSVRIEKTKLLDRLIIIVLTLAVSYFAIDKFVFDPERDEVLKQTAKQQGRVEAKIGSYGDHSIAVLPFVNMSSDPEQEYFSDGISEELLNLLAKIPQLRVISRSSAFTYKGKDISLPEIAKQLGVAHILEGSVRKSGDQIRITAQLIDARSDTHLWSETYDRRFKDIFAIQDDIAADVVENLKLKLTGGPLKSRRTDTEAFRLTLQVKTDWYNNYRRDTFNRTRNMAMIDRALELDPNYIPAIFWKGNFIFWKAGEELQKGLIDAEEYLKIISVLQENANRMYEIDPDNAFVLVALGFNSYLNKQFQKAADSFSKALKLAPRNDEIIRTTLYMAWRMHQTEQGIKIANWGFQINPVCKRCLRVKIYLLSSAGRYDDALEVAESYIYNSMDSIAPFRRAEIALLQRKPALAQKYITSSDNLRNRQLINTIALHELGQYEKSKAELQKLIDDNHDHNEFSIALIQSWTGNEKAALDYLYQQYWPHMIGFRDIYNNPMWHHLHDHPRWRALLEKSGYTPEAFAAVEFNVELPD